MKKSLSVKLLCVFMSILFLCQFIPLSAEQTNLPAESATVITEKTEEPAVIVAEDETKRERNVKHFLLSDGTYSAVVYDEPVHFEQDGAWVDIDNSLEAAVLIGDPLTGTVERDSAQTQSKLGEFLKKSKSSFNTDYLENKRNDFKVQLPAALGEDAPIMIGYGDYSLRFSFENIDVSSADIRQPASEASLASELQTKLNGVTDKAERAKIQNNHAAALTQTRSSVSYAAVQSGVDVNYYLSGEKLKEDLVFGELPEAQSFSFVFTYDGLHAVLEDDNSVIFYDENNEAIFTVDAPYMYDSSEDGYSRDIEVTLEETSTGCVYTLTPNRTWLTDPARVYPVTLDPMISTSQTTSVIQDAGVQENDPALPYPTSNRIYVGYGSTGKMGRMYIKFNSWPSATGLASTTITSAYMYLSYYPMASWQTAHSLYIDLYKMNTSWNHTNLTWNNQINYSATYLNQYSIYDSRNKTSGYDAIDVTSWVKSHYTNPFTDYGIRLQPNTGNTIKSSNRACYISAEYTTASLRPIVHIYYTPDGQTQGITNGQIYYLRNLNSGKYMNVPSSTDGTDLTQSTFSGSVNQQFKVVYRSATGDYVLIPMRIQSSAVEIENWSSANNAPVQIWDHFGPNYMDSQRFRIIRNNDGSYRIVSYVSGYSKAFMVKGASTTENEKIIQYDDLGWTSESWNFEPMVYTLNIKQYYDSGYASRYGGTPSTQIASYTKIVTDYYKQVFGININNTVTSYTSPADGCTHKTSYNAFCSKKLTNICYQHLGTYHCTNKASMLYTCKRQIPRT